MHCLDSGTGREIWVFRPYRRLEGFTVISPDGRIFIKTVKDSLICVSPGGRELWRYQLKTELKVPPASDINGTLYLLQTDGLLLCLNREGHKVWDFQCNDNFADIYALEKGVMLLGTGKTVFLYPNGTIRNEKNIAFSYLLYDYPDLYGRTVTGEWGRLDTDSLEFIPGNNPLEKGTLFPDARVLITLKGHIVSGREDWFMQAMDAGEEAYDPYYQSGGNPLRSKGTDRSADPAGRRREYNAKGGNLLLSLFTADPSVLNSYLLPYENVNSLQELMTMDYDYDLALYDILAESNKISADSTQFRTDSYSRSRVYRILTKWGDLRIRESLLLLAKMEKDPYNLALIMDGLGIIGLDNDGKSMDTIRAVTKRFSMNSSVLYSAVVNAARLARYNGGRSNYEMMDFYNTLQNRTLPGKISSQIREEMRSF